MRIKSLLICMGLIGFSIPSYARDLHARLGLGYNSQFSNASLSHGVPGLSIKYGLTTDFAIGAVGGFTTSSPSNSVIGLKLYKNIFFETNLNFYATIGGGLVTGNGESGVEFVGGPGVEFFIPGLESLGFSVETGISVSNVSGTFVLKTTGLSFLNAGIHFYF